MRILMYRKPKALPERDIIGRAAHKQHMERKTRLWDLGLFLTVGILGVLLHMAGPIWSRYPLLRVIAPINESVWEHLKLLFYPALLVAIVRRLLLGRLQHGILQTFLEGTLLAMSLMLIGFYTYSGILGTQHHQANITLFFLCDLVLTLHVRLYAERQKKSSLPALFVWLLLAGCFVWFSFHPPGIGIFQDLSQSLQSLQLLQVHPWADPSLPHSFLQAFR